MTWFKVVIDIGDSTIKLKPALFALDSIYGSINAEHATKYGYLSL